MVNSIMNNITVSNLKVNRTIFTVASLTEESDEKAYWHSCTPHERLQHLDLLRRINYGDKATARLQRVLEIVERSGS